LELEDSFVEAVFGSVDGRTGELGLSQSGGFGAHLRQKNGEKLVFFCIFV